MIRRPQIDPGWSDEKDFRSVVHNTRELCFSRVLYRPLLAGSRRSIALISTWFNDRYWGKRTFA